MAARSTVSTVYNKTPYKLTLMGAVLSHGGWMNSMTPHRRSRWERAGALVQKKLVHLPA